MKSEKTLESTKLKAEIDSLKLSLEQARSSLDVAEASIVELKAIISDDAKNSDSLGDVFNGSELKAKLAVAELNIEKLKDRLQEESGARQFLEGKFYKLYSQSFQPTPSLSLEVDSTFYMLYCRISLRIFVDQYRKYRNRVINGFKFF